MPFRNGEFVKWRHHVKVKDVLVKSDDPTPEELTASMQAVYKRLQSQRCFRDFYRLGDFDSEFEDCDEANDLLAVMYDYADAHLIWIE